MQWKHVQVHGFWTWTAVHVAGGVVAKPGKPYDCHAGLANWKLGWSGGTLGDSLKDRLKDRLKDI